MKITLTHVATSATFVMLLQVPAFATTPYFDQLRFAAPAFVGQPYTTSQQWDSLNGASTWAGSATPTAGNGNFLSNSNPTPLSTPILTFPGATSLTPYFFGGGAGNSTIRNYGSTSGGTVGGNLIGTNVVLQFAATQGGTGASPTAPTGVQPGIANVRIVAGGTTYSTPTATQLLDSRPNAVAFSFTDPATNIPYTPTADQFSYSFFIPYTGDFSVQWTQPFHSVFEALRVDTQLVAVPEPTTLATLGLAGFGLLARRRRSI